MGLMDKVKTAAKDLDTKAGNAIDKSKLDSQIRDEERNIEKMYTEIGKKIIAALKEERSASDADIKCEVDKINESETKIEELKKKKEEIEAGEKKD